MARNLRCNLLGTFALFLAAASFAAVSPAMARDADDAFMPLKMTTPTTAAMALIRPQARPDPTTPVAFEVTRTGITAPNSLVVPRTVDRARIRATWAIGVFR